MLLKIITNRNTTKIITGIEDIEILGSALGIDGNPVAVENYEDMLIAGAHPRHDCLTIEDIDTYDSFAEQTSGSHAKKYIPKFVDIWMQGRAHRRVAIAEYAYYCNDDGNNRS